MVAFVPSIITAILTALVAVRLSIRQFHSQRWWEKKAETYSAILEHLSELHSALSESWQDILEIRNIGPIKSERTVQLRAMNQNARLAIAKAAATGSFIVSSETARVLENLNRELQTEEGGNPANEYERLFKALRQAISKIREEAKSELGVR